MLTLRRKITGALGGGGGSSSSLSNDALPTALVITASPPPPPPAPPPHKSPSLSMSMIGSPRVATPTMQSSPLHQHQPQAPRRASIAWVPDSLADKCYACAASFSLLVRRHHCRRCGNVFCDACSQSRIPLVAAGFLTPVRVCDKCCVAAKKAHARLVVDRQQQLLQEQHSNKEKRNRLRSMRSDDSVVYEEPSSSPPPRPPLTISGSTRRLPQQHQSAIPRPHRPFVRSQTVRQLTGGPPVVPLGRSRTGIIAAGGVPTIRQFFADPYGEVEEDDDERRSFERRTGLGGTGTETSNEVTVQTLPGEVLLVRCESVRCRLMNQFVETEGTLYVTSYRLVFSPTIVNNVPEYEEHHARPVHQAIPLGTIERLKRKEVAESDMGLLDIVTKDFRHVQFFFHGLVAKQKFNQFDRTIYTIRQYAFNEPTPVAEPFLRATAVATAADKTASSQASFNGWTLYDMASEYHRLGVGSNCANATPRWRLTSVNEEYGLCGTYPSLLAVPSSVGDQVLTVAAKYRSKGRIPVLSWRNKCTGAVICRSSQPLVGLGQRQCDKDVFLIQSIAVANPSSSKFVIIDARPWKNAVAQKTVGSAGYELTEKYETRHSSATSKFADLAASSTDFGGMGTSTVLPSPPSSVRLGDLAYDDEDDGSASTVSDRIFRPTDLDPSLILTECKLIFMGIENIHTMRKSYNRLLDLCIHKPTDKWVEQLGSSRWIEHISKILDSAVEIVRIVHDEKSSVLVHCSDGWDRTPQLTSLAQLMMDPYYRTLEGFQVLIEKEWCSFGHKFGDRSAHGVNPTESHDISPVFLQFIDCVWQIYRQFPCAFEFNEQFLMLILDHLYACRFGTFMFDSEKERRDKRAQDTTISLWTYMASLEQTGIRNAFYIAPRKLSGVSISDPAAGPLSAQRDDEGTSVENSKSAPPSESSTEGSTTQETPLIPGLEEETDEDDVLRPCAWSRALHFWTRYYLRWDPSTLTDRVGTVWIETAHRDLQERLDEAERQLAAMTSESSSDRGSGGPSLNLPELVQAAAKSVGEDGPVTATVPLDVIEKLEALEQRKRDALARIEKEFEEDAARLLRPTLDRPATAAS